MARLIVFHSASGSAFGSRGFQISGMIGGLASGEAAARTVIEAKSRDDFSERGLSRYKELLKESFVLRDLEAYRNVPEFLENKRMFKAYPELVTRLAGKLFTVDGAPPVNLMKMILGQIKGSGISLIQLARDGWKGVRNL